MHRSPLQSYYVPGLGLEPLSSTFRQLLLGHFICACHLIDQIRRHGINSPKMVAAKEDSLVMTITDSSTQLSSIQAYNKSLTRRSTFFVEFRVFDVPCICTRWRDRLCSAGAVIKDFAT